MRVNALISCQLFFVLLICPYGASHFDPPPFDPDLVDEIENVHVADGLIDDYNSFYDFDVVDIDGDNVPLDTYRGMVTLVVNVASECGYTDGHYRNLVRLQNTFGQLNKFSVLAFPCNQFGQQEPGTRKKIISFTKDKYHVNFPIFDKIHVLPPNVAEPWEYLIESSGVAPTWNFWKYLVDENGHVIDAWGPEISVESIFHEVKEAVNKISTHAYDEL